MHKGVVLTDSAVYYCKHCLYKVNAHIDNETGKIYTINFIVQVKNKDFSISIFEEDNLVKIIQISNLQIWTVKNISQKVTPKFMIDKLNNLLSYS